MIYIGIDPGKDGAIAMYRDGAASFFAMPKVVIGKSKKGSSKTRVDWVALAQLIHGIAERAGSVHFVIENLVGFGTSKGTGTGQFNFARDYGVILGIVTALKLPYTLVTPQKWQKMVGAGSLDSGNSYVLRAQQIFPTAELIPPGCRKPSDGRAAALLMAYCGYLMYGQHSA